MKTFSIYETKTKLSDIIDLVIAGESCAISRHGKLVATIIPYKAQKKKRVFGYFKNKIKLLPGWNEPMSEAQLSDWRA